VTTATATLRPSAPGRLSRVAWYHPEWIWTLVAVVSWVLLVLVHVRGWSLFGDTHTGVQPADPATTTGVAGDAAMHHTAMNHAAMDHAAMPAEAPHHMGAHSGSWLSAQGDWMLMATAMMLPAALPMAQHVAMSSRWKRRQRAAAVFVGTYLVVWLLFGVVVVSIARWAPLPTGAEWPLVAVLLVAAAWELTPAKRRWLRACHRTYPLPPDGWKANAGCVRFGLRHGQASVGSCWALMLPMAIAGHLSLLLMGLLTLIVVAEEVAVKGVRLVKIAAPVLVVAAAVLSLGAWG
jgi:predicted metal-binding membrane protein